jgi:hypothetical protein
MVSPRSTLIDLALDIVDGDGAGSSLSTSGISFLDFSNFKGSQSLLVSASSPRKQHCTFSDFKKSRSALLSASSKNHKSISFCFDEYDEVREISHINDFSQKKIDRLWFSHEEESVIREECLELVGRFDAGEVMDKEVMLGLEKHTKAGLEPVKKLRRVVNETVFSLQKVQQRISVTKPNLIAKFYERISIKPALEARLRALELALEVKTESGISNAMRKGKNVD